MENKTQIEIEQELNEQFKEFLKTKGIVAKFKLAFSNIVESAKKQHEADLAQIEAIKNSQENKDFKEFLNTKGFKAKVKLVIENIKRGAKEQSQKTKEHIAKVNAQTSRSITKKVETKNVTAEELNALFNEFLAEKGLESNFVIEVRKQ